MSDDITLIIIDQLRADYKPYLTGISEILPYHAVCETNSIPSSTEAMHANISTGLYPKDHGFISKYTRTGRNGLDQIMQRLSSHEISSLAMMAREHDFNTLVIGGKKRQYK